MVVKTAKCLLPFFFGLLGELSVTSYQNATTVFFNPQFPDLEQKRKLMLARVTNDDVASSVPIL